MPMTVKNKVFFALVSRLASSRAVMKRKPEYKPIATAVTATSQENQLSRVKIARTKSERCMVGD